MRTAVIGLGVIGKVHAGVLADQGKEIAALCDVDPAAAEHVRQTYAPDALVYTDWRRMLDEVRPDVLHICTPHYLHAEMVIECLGRNIHTLCEKPLCICREEMDAVLDAERKSKAVLGVCHQNRFLPVHQYVKKHLSDKTVTAAHGSVVWHRDAAYYRSAEWRGTRRMEGGGVLINQALHTLDLLLWYCGDPVSVTARDDNFTLRGEIEVEDTLSAVCAGTHPFTFFATNAGGTDMPPEIRLHLSGAEPVTVLPNGLLEGGIYRSFREPLHIPGAKACYGGGHALLIDEFYRCLAAGESFSVNGAEGARVIRLILAAYESRGETVPL